MSGSVRPYLADILSVLRMSASFLLFAFDPTSATYIAMVAVIGLTDVFDGAVARRFGSTSKGSVIDSVADAVFFVCLLLSFIPAVRWELWMIVWMAIIAVLKISVMATSDKAEGLHTVSAKVTGAIIAVVPLMSAIVTAETAVLVACTVATTAAVIELSVSIRLMIFDKG